MEEYIYQLRSYLPIEFEENDTNEFIQYLIEAYIDNVYSEKYQFSFTAFHMLYMSYIYKVKWSLKELNNQLIKESLDEYIKQNRNASFNTLFDLSQIPEKTSLEKLLKSLNFHANDVDTCKNLVEIRNKCSHASGKIYLKRQQQIENYILEEMDNVKAIHEKLKTSLKIIIENFINQTWDKNWIGNDIRDWYIKNYLSQKDIEEIMKMKLSFLKLDSNSKEIIFKKLLYCVLVWELVKLSDNKDEYFLKSLTILMKGLSEIRNDDSDLDRGKSNQELIEEKILPILTELTNEESIKAQEILRLNGI